MARGGPGAGRDAGAVLFWRWWDSRLSLSRHAAGNLKHSHRPAATLSSFGHPPAVASVLGRAAVNWTASAGRLAPAAIDALDPASAQGSPRRSQVQRTAFNVSLLGLAATHTCGKSCCEGLGSNGSPQAVAPDARGILGRASAACCRAGPREPQAALQAALQARTTRTGG